MNELYWITRFSGIHGMCVIITAIAAIIFTISLIGYIVNDDPDRLSEVRSRKSCLMFLKKSSIALTIGMFGIIFVPTTREALTIWGVGGTIDYIKSNPTAKQLPDKCIKALDKWVDSWTEKKDSVAHK